MYDAACRGMDVNLFMPERGDIATVNNAKRICATCPVQTQCLEYGLEEKHGIWGGMAEAPRRKLRAKRLRETGKRYTRLKPIDHGTVAGYHAHTRRNEPACRACREAWAADRRRRKQDARQTG